MHSHAGAWERETKSRCRLCAAYLVGLLKSIGGNSLGVGKFYTINQAGILLP
jgi:hypothetical protein